MMLSGASRHCTTHILRLRPDDEIVGSIMSYVQDNNITAGYIGTCVGSFTKACIRFANRPQGSDVEGFLEVVSLTGMVSCVSVDGGKKNNFHLHASVSDGDGRTLGGHLISGHVYTTMEIAIVSLDGLSFNREMEAKYGYKELVVVGVTK